MYTRYITIFLYEKVQFTSLRIGKRFGLALASNLQSKYQQFYIIPYRHYISNIF